MARMKVTTKKATPSRSLVAAAGSRQVITRKSDRQRRSVKAQAWQADAWRYYDSIGELRYAVNWFSSALARANLYIGKRNADGSIERSNDADANGALTELVSRGESRIMKLMGQHYFMTGEWYAIGQSDEEGQDFWEVYSATEVKRENGKWYLDLGGVTHREELTNEDAILRLWTPHPNRHGEPDSPVRAVLDNLEEIRLLTSHIRSQVLSRLAGAGILVLPQEMTFSPPPDISGQIQEVSSSDEFMSILNTAMTTPIKNPEDPSSIVPIVIQAPAEVIDKIAHLKFWSDLDKEATEMRREAIGRLALGLDMPPEVLTGTAEANHWGAWAIEESTIKAHIEPALDLICGQLTVEFLRPSVSDPTLFIAYDTTDLKLRPNRSKESIELYDRGELSAAAMRRETGFSEDDAPDDEDLKRFILKTMAKGSATPEMVAAAARELGINIEAVGDEMRQERPAPSLVDHPDETPPELMPDAVAGACEAVVLRAMERAGNKMKNGLPKSSGLAAMDIYRHVKVNHDQVPILLDDAWSMLDRLVPPSDLEWIEKGLNDYATRLLRTQEPISREEMLKCLTAKRSHQMF